MKVMNPWRKAGIRTKLLFHFYTIILMVSLFMGILSSVLAERYILEKVSITHLHAVRQFAAILTLLRDGLTDISTQICLNTDVQDVLLQTDQSGSEYRYSIPGVSNLTLLNHAVSYMALYGNRGEAFNYHFSDLSYNPRRMDEILPTELYRRTKEQKGAAVWFALGQGENELMGASSDQKIVLCRIVKRIEDGSTPIGFLSIGMDAASIFRLFSSYLQEPGESVLILDNQNLPLYRHGEQTDSLLQLFHTSRLSLEKVNQVSFEGQKTLVSTAQSGQDGWTILYSAPITNFSSRILVIRLLALGSILLWCLLLLPLSLRFSHSLTFPIGQLLHAMNLFQASEFHTRVRIDAEDELGQLGAGFNKMAAEIQHLFEKVYLLQIREKEAELDALQAQIRPHFLYNTLDSIYWRSVASGQNEVSEMVFSLSRLFRLSLNRGENHSTLSQEAELLEHYLRLVQIRHGSRLSYAIDIGPDALVCVVPSFVLQPFAENAIKHGLEGGTRSVSVSVTCRASDGRLVCEIFDNGAGMTAETLDEVRDAITLPQDITPHPKRGKGGMAIRNVAQRLHLLYGDESQLRIESAPGVGTLVNFSFPAQVPMNPTLVTVEEEKSK